MLIFSKINSNKLPSGYEIYLSLLIKSPVNFLDIFSVKNLFLSSEIQSNDSIQQYKNFIKQRYQDENIDHKRPLMNQNNVLLTLMKF